MTTLTNHAKAKHLVNSHHGYQLEAAIADAFAAERERCAKIAEGFVDSEWPNDDQSNQAKAIASAIRVDR